MADKIKSKPPKFVKKKGEGISGRLAFHLTMSPFPAIAEK